MTKLFLVLHILSGSLSLITGTWNMFAKKGGKRHKLMGNIFTYGMLVANLSAIIISIQKDLYFLFLIAIFSLYLTMSGYLHMKGKPNSMALQIASWLMLIFGIILFLTGAVWLINGQLLGWAPVLFSSVGMVLSGIDLLRPATAFNLRKKRHLQRMSGAYIATLTAFLVVNVRLPSYLPGVIAWLLPTIVITPLIIRWSREN